MPVYEYQCKACGRDFEYQQRMSDPDKTTCEVCGGALDRLISRTAFSLKGSGWYKDLYASPKPETAAKSDGADKAAGSEAKTDGKSADGKAADKPAAKSDAPAASGDKPAAKPPSSSGSSSGGGSGGSSGSGGGGSSGSSGGGSSGSVAKAS
jgi:putative FmdB family regulatory protein